MAKSYKILVDGDNYELTKEEIIYLFIPSAAHLVLKVCRQGGEINISSSKIKPELIEKS